MRSVNVHGHPGYTLWLGDDANVGVEGEFGGHGWEVGWSRNIIKRLISKKRKGTRVAPHMECSQTSLLGYARALAVAVVATFPRHPNSSW